MTKVQDDIEYCEGYSESKRWLAHYGTLKSKQTAAGGLRLFCTKTGRTPTELLALRKEAEVELFNLVEDFSNDQTIPDEPRRTAISSVRAFFRRMWKELPSAVGSSVWSLPRKKPKRTPTAETLRTFMQGAWHVRDKALISFMSASCVAEGSIPHLSFLNLEPQWQGENPTADFAMYLDHLEATDMPYIKIVGKVMPDGSTTLKGGGQGKYKGVEQHTFLTPEATRLLMQYVKWRLNTGEQLGYESPLFAVWKTCASKKGDPLQIGGVKTIFRLVTQRNPEQIHFSAHDMRRYTQNALEDARIHPNRCAKIRGRKVRGEVDPYSDPKIGQLRRDYNDAVEYLTFMESEKVIKVEDLQKEVMKALKSNGALDELLKPIAKREGVTIEFLKKNLMQMGKKAEK